MDDRDSSDITNREEGLIEFWEVVKVVRMFVYHPYFGWQAVEKPHQLKEDVRGQLVAEQLLALNESVRINKG